jgi:type III restriction enzyme
MTQPSSLIHKEAIEPLYMPWEPPSKHRVKAKRDGERAEIVTGRRPSPLPKVNSLRRAVSEWRGIDYAGASDTSRELLDYWFNREHALTATLSHPSTGLGGTELFRYYFCQREAIETLIYLMEVRNIRTLAALTAEFSEGDAETAAMGVNPEQDQWARYAFKVATGAGKTKIMSLAIVWSYFHSLRESDSTMAQHFVLVAPNLTVFERLKEDFGNGRIFDTDPLIPPHWRGDWNMSVVLQDEASGAATGGVVYLTNIHRLYAPKRRTRETEMHDWMGPSVSRATALDTGAALRERILSHPRLMVLNDEAHHVWDPDSAWNEAIAALHSESTARSGNPLCAQLDFSATPKDNKGNQFQHIVCDTPLGEAVDAGIVKTPIIGQGSRLAPRADDNAAYKYEEHLQLGYARWLQSRDEWDKSGKKALLFVMCEDTEAADQITDRLNSDPAFEALNGKTLNLHTNLKGKIKKRGKGEAAWYEFVEDDDAISDDDLKTLRKLSRELDEDTSPYRCIVSVLMLREGWDVRNVTTIVPLRPYSSKANILPEQTLGRGLRRMTPPGPNAAAEIVAVVEHPAFASLYKDELAQQGVLIEVVDADKVPRTTVTIFPDQSKDLKQLDLLIPRLTQAYRQKSELGSITLDEVRKAFSKFKPLPLGQPRSDTIEYQGKHMLTGEIVEQMNVKLPLLKSGFGAISYFREYLERTCRISGAHAKLAPLLQSFLTEILFEQKVTINDGRLIGRLADSDVREHLMATFVPLIRSKITVKEERAQAEPAMSVTSWRPYQVTSSERHPVTPAARSPFNLTPCNREFELVFARFVDEKASDAAAFCKNAGPQALRIDYLANGSRLSFYTPDFIVRLASGRYLLVETKGEEDLDVPAKARAAVAWCEAASKQGDSWQYLYLPEKVFYGFHGNTLEELLRASEPALANVQHLAKENQVALPLFEITAEQKDELLGEFIAGEDLQRLTPRARKSVEEAITVFKFLENKEMSFSPAFTPLLGPLDEAATQIIVSRLRDLMPAFPDEQKAWFEPSYASIDSRSLRWYQDLANNLKRTLVHLNPVMPLGLLAFCLDYAGNSRSNLAGVFEAVRNEFANLADGTLARQLEEIKNFRNKHIAHQSEPLTDAGVSRDALRKWISGLTSMQKAR